MMSTTAKVALALMLLGSGSFGARRQQPPRQGGPSQPAQRLRQQIPPVALQSLSPGCVSDWRRLHSARRPQRRRRLLTDVNGA